MSLIQARGPSDRPHHICFALPRLASFALPVQASGDNLLSDEHRSSAFPLGLASGWLMTFELELSRPPNRQLSALPHRGADIFAARPMRQGTPRLSGELGMTRPSAGQAVPCHRLHPRRTRARLSQAESGQYLMVCAAEADRQQTGACVQVILVQQATAHADSSSHCPPR